MFTGIIEEIGKISSFVKSGNSAKIRINCKKVLEGSIEGDSIAVNGVCLTAVKICNDYFEADLSYETIAKSSLKEAIEGWIVNLERALTLNSRLGGHLVQGHVDCTATIISIMKKGDSYLIKVNYPKEFDKYISEKGSVTLDGISLTVTNVKNSSFQVAIIPHTFENTNLKYKKNGSAVNLETDQIVRYIEKLLKNDTDNIRLKSLIDKL